jgi:phytoene dehydrogenase-like protein
MGHLLRDHPSFPAVRRVEKFPIVIVGGGIAGLSAGWRLRKRGFKDFVLLEMNDQAGGNARWGQNDVSAYPWAAHYVPVPGPNATYVRELFEDLGVLKEGKWEERYLCFSPQERLFLYGRWQDGIEPAVGLSQKDRDQFQRFEDVVNRFRSSRTFTIPLEHGINSRFKDLDQIPFSEWLKEQGFESQLLNWYLNYACRDDYGALTRDTSAWAGIHYFASRELEEKGPLTWPEGNGWITRRLLERVGENIRTGRMVRRIIPENRRVRVYSGEIEFQAEFVIFAAPTFLAPFVIDDFPRLQDFVYSPWLTANITLERLPDSRGAEPTWDTVFFDSPTLGYVDATHQTLRTHIDRTVWTFYWALAEGSPAQNRQLLLDKDWTFWKEAILHDLERVHSDIRACVSRIDIMRMGHAMVRPSIGSIFSEERKRLSRMDGRILFSNSDLSGISIFEEAQYHGVEAAHRALQGIGHAS